MNSGKNAVMPTRAATGKKPALAAVVQSDAFWIGLLCLTAVLIFGEFLFSDKMLSASDQLTGIDSRVFMKEALTRFHQFPTWFSVRLSGMPTVDAMFGDALYPPFLFLQYVVSVHRLLGLNMVFHILLAGIFFYILLYKGFGFSRTVAFAGGLFYMLNPQMVSLIYSGHSGKIFIAAWLPYVVWRMKALMEKPAVLNASLLALGIGMCLLTSHVQLSYFMLWGLFLYWLFSLFLMWRDHRDVKKLMLPGLLFWAAVGAGLGISFIQTVPTYLFVRDAHSVRGVDRGMEFAASWSMHWPEAFSLWVPDFGRWLEYYWSENPFKLNTEYAGAAATLLAVLAVINKPRPWRIFWGCVALLAILFSMGAHTPVWQLAYYLIPGVKKMRACSMMMFWYSFSVVLLSSLILNDCVSGVLASGPEKKKNRFVKVLLITGGVITGAALLFSVKGFVSGLTGALTPALMDQKKAMVFDRNFTANFLPALWMWWLFAIVIVGFLWAVVSGKVKGGWALAAVILVGTADMVRVDRHFIKVISERPYVTMPPAFEPLRKEMANRPLRCYSLPGALQTNGEGIYGLEGLEGFHDNELRWYRQFRSGGQISNFLTGLVEFGPDGSPYLNRMKMGSGNNFLNLANAEYIIARQGPNYMTIRNQGALPRLSFVPGYTVMAEEEIVTALKNNTYDIRTTTALLEEPGRKPADTGDSLRPFDLPVTWENYSPNVRIAHVTAPRDGFLRLSEVFYEGWKVQVDGAPADVYRADLAWMAVYVTAGRHTVVMRPESLYMSRAAMVSFPVWILLVLYWISYGVTAAVKRGKKVAG